jgi:hypothetical protein
MSIHQQIFEARLRFEREMRNVTSYGRVRYNGLTVMGNEVAAIAHQRIEVLTDLSIEILDMLNQIGQALERIERGSDDGK